MRALIVTAALLCGIEGASASRQENNVVVVEGRYYLTPTGPALKGSFPGIEIPKYYRVTTANTRGYRATWAIIDNRLYLVGIEAAIVEGDGRFVESSKAIPGLKFPAFAEGYSGTFGFRARHDDYEDLDGHRLPIRSIFLTFKNGVLVKTERKLYADK